MGVRQVLARCLLRIGRGFDDNLVPCCENLSFLAGPVLLLIGTLLVAFLATLGYIYVIPLRGSSSGIKILLYVYLTLGLINLVARYIYTVMTNPGTPNSFIYTRLRKSRARIKPENVHWPPSLLAWTRCRITGIPKPPRAHFDSVNMKLIVNFDHWCPWVFNSIGYGNYRHFVMFIFWVWLLTGSGALFAVEPFFEGLKRGTVQDDNFYTEVAYVALFCICIALNIAIGILFGWHIYLILTNQTSIDVLILTGRRLRHDINYPNVFDLGSMRKNLYSIIFSEGGGWWELLIPPPPYWQPKGEPYPGAFDGERVDENDVK